MKARGRQEREERGQDIQPSATCCDQLSGGSNLLSSLFLTFLSCLVSARRLCSALLLRCLPSSLHSHREGLPTPRRPPAV